MKAVVVLSAGFLAILFLVAIVGMIALWFYGWKTVGLPGLGIVVTTPVLVLVLVSADAILGIIIFLLWRN